MDYTSDSDDEDNYYAVLGVPVSASNKDIKRAYYGYMKELHPDVSVSRDSDDSDDDSALQHDLAVFMNEVYDTLSDPDKRAAYDEIVGLSANGINPFKDTSYEADKVFVDEYTCIGCRNCANVCGKTFFIEEEHGRARAVAQGVDSDEQLQEAIDTCPVSCIYWVTAPQLTGLEDQMRRMERKAAWLLMNGGGSAVNVFFEASNAWEKRRSLARARVYAEKGAAMRRNFWETWSPSASASSYAAADSESEEDGEEAESSAGPNRGDVRRKTAASVAAAARRWRDLRRVQRKRRDTNKEVLLIAASSSSVDGL